MELARTDQPVSGLSRPPGKTGPRKKALASDQRPNGRVHESRTAKDRVVPKHGDQENGDQGPGPQQTGIRGTGVRACVDRPVGVRKPSALGNFLGGPNNRKAGGGIHLRTGVRTNGAATSGDTWTGTRSYAVANTGARARGVRKNAVRQLSQPERSFGPKGRGPEERTTSTRRPKDREAGVRRPTSPNRRKARSPEFTVDGPIIGVFRPKERKKTRSSGPGANNRPRRRPVVGTNGPSLALT